MALDVLNEIGDMANVITYNSVLHALSMGGACDQAVELLNRMKTEGRVHVRCGHFCDIQQQSIYVEAWHCLVQTEARDLRSPYYTRDVSISMRHGDPPLCRVLLGSVASST